MLENVENLESAADTMSIEVKSSPKVVVKHESRKGRTANATAETTNKTKGHTRRVHFANCSTKMHKASNSSRNNGSQNGSIPGGTPPLPSILKSRKLEYSVGVSDNEKSLAELLSEVQKLNRLKKDIIPTKDSDLTPIRRKRGRPKGSRNLHRTMVSDSQLADVNQIEIINPEKSPGSDTKEVKTSLEPQSSLKDHGLPEVSTASQPVHNTRRKPRKSIKDLLPDISENSASHDKGRGRGRSRGRGRGRGRGTGTGTGRGKESPRGKGSSRSLVADNKEMSTDTSSIIGDLEDNIDSPQIQMVKCAKCSSKMLKNQWSAHNLSQHNGMAWQESSPPFDFDNDQKLLTRVLVSAHKKKKGVLTCEQCGTAKRSVVGFMSHMQFCGKTVEEKSALLITCPICNRTMMPSSMEVHHRVHKESAELPIPDGSPVVPTGSKRKAAEKAITRISEFTALVKDDDEPASKKTRPSSPTIKNMISRPNMRKTIPGVLRALWKKEILSKGEAVCRQPGCTEKFKNIDELYKHYSMCNFTPLRNFSCKLCKFESGSETDVINHVTEMHTLETAPTEASESEEYTDDDLEEPQVKRKSHAANRNANQSKGRAKHWHRVAFLAREKTQDINKLYRPAVKWTIEFELENYQLNLFSNLVPNKYELLQTEEAKRYLPELEISMATRKMPMNQYNTEIQSSQIEWKQWHKFEGDVVEGVPTFFVGGPVWALAWLPIPVPMFSHNVDQYLALSTHPTMESEYSLGHSYSGDNGIQIWNVGKLRNAREHVVEKPDLSYVIAHTSGTIWCMEWCPSGCYQDKVLSNCPPKNGAQDSMRRMGLLATACSDGCVHIYSVPFPEELRNRRPKGNRHPTYKTDPVMTLVVNTVMYVRGKQNWQCTKLNWTKERSHDTIVAGFSNGYVALWNITTTSELLLKKQQNTIFINAVHHFYSHGHSVSAVSLVPYGGKRYLATAGLDRCHKFWDLENTSGPQSVFKRGVVADGTWMTHWPAIVNSFDDVLGLNHTCTNLNPIREYGYKLCLALSANSPVYTVSVSDYANAIAHGSLAGEVQTAFAHQLLIGVDGDRSVPKKRRLSSLVRVVELRQDVVSTEDKSLPSQEKKSKKHSEVYRYMSDTYEESKDRYGIIFYDMPSDSKGHIPEEIEKKPLQVDRLDLVPLEAYPFMSANKVSWNPNPWSYLWLVTGYQCGIVRISCFNSTNTMKDLLPEYVKRFLAKGKERTD